MIVGKTRTNQPVEGDGNAIALELTGKDIAPKDVNASGKVTGDEIVENMEGYSFTPSDEHYSIELEYHYAGVVKNGNKLTMAISLSLTRKSTVGEGITIGSFALPEDVFAKLIPTQVGAYEGLDVQNVFCADSLWTGVNVVTRTTKGLTAVNIIMDESAGAGLNQLVVDTKYFARFEVTFLLSDSLIPEPEQEGE